jgi:hypothetical protein
VTSRRSIEVTAVRALIRLVESDETQATIEFDASSYSQNHFLPKSAVFCGNNMEE